MQKHAALSFNTSREARDYAVDALSRANRMRSDSHRTDAAAFAATNQERDLRRRARYALSLAIELERKGL